MIHASSQLEKATSLPPPSYLPPTHSPLDSDLRVMEASWLETRWARPLHLALVFCLALVLMQAMKLYLRRQRLLRDLRPFPGPPAHWLLGHQKVGGERGAAGCCRGNS